MNEEFTPNLTQYQIALLKSLVKGPKYLHMGKSPVDAISAGFQLEEMGFVRNDAGWLHLTQEGRIALVNSGAFNGQQ